MPSMFKKCVSARLLLHLPVPGVGVSKPDPAIFKFALDQSGLPGESVSGAEILHIGDDLDKDYFGAKSVGWNALILDRSDSGQPLLDKKIPKLDKADVCKDFKDVFARLEL